MFWMNYYYLLASLEDDEHIDADEERFSYWSTETVRFGSAIFLCFILGSSSFLFYFTATFAFAFDSCFYFYSFLGSSSFLFYFTAVYAFYSSFVLSASAFSSSLRSLFFLAFLLSFWSLLGLQSLITYFSSLELEIEDDTF